MRTTLASVVMILTLLRIAAAIGQESPAKATDPAPAAGPTSSGLAPAPSPATTEPPRGTGDSMCLLIESAATANGLPLEFFTRLIWQESNFRSDAVGPLTRHGGRALGIAQFMPGTATERELLDPFDPVQALPKAAELLRDLRAEFGNLGLAAAAYNAGPRRVHDWLEGRGTLPAQTQHYVDAITGRSPEDWLAGKPASNTAPSPPPSCNNMLALLKRAPSLFVDELQQRVTASASSPWGVELSAGFSRERVLATYAGIEQRHRELVGGLDMIVQRTTLRSRGPNPFYQVRIGASTRATANDLCARLQAARVACLVLRNRA